MASHAGADAIVLGLGAMGSAASFRLAASGASVIGFYGFPAVDGPGGGVKVATESYERTTHPDGRRHPATPEEVETMYRRCIGS